MRGLDIGTKVVVLVGDYELKGTCKCITYCSDPTVVVELEDGFKVQVPMYVVDWDC